MNLANLLSLARLLSVPVIIWLILVESWHYALGLFILAGITDALDGWIAKRFKMRTELGAYLDPIADKAMLMSIYVVLAYQSHLPLWLTILVVSRDLLIIGGVMLSFAMGIALPIKPLWVSKANTLAQILLAIYVLALLSLSSIYEFPSSFLATLIIVVAVTTILSGAQYVIEWAKGQSGTDPSPTEDQKEEERGS